MSVRINRYSMQLVRESAKTYDVSKRLDSPEAAARLIHSVLDVNSLHVEHFGILTLDTKNQVIGFHILGIGTLNSAAVHPRNIFQAALLNNAAGFILFHNHPSGDPAPSPEDIKFTRKISAIGDLMGIDAIDHIIVGSGDKFTSLKQTGVA